MILITDAAIQAAEDQASAAERELAAAEAPLVRAPRRLDEETAGRLAALTIQVRHARAKVGELSATQAEQRRALEARAQREEKAAPALGTAVKELDESRRRLVAAVTAGDLLTAGRAALAHDALVVRVRDLLVGAQLRLDDVAEGVDHATGADASPAGVIRLRGRFWGRLDAAAVLGWMTHRTACHLLGRTVADRIVAGAPRYRLEHRTDGLLDGVPDLPPYAEAPRSRPPSVPRDTVAVAMAKPFLARDRGPTPTPGWEEQLATGTYPGAPRDAA